MKVRETHGAYGTRLYHAYNNMKQRCLNKNFKQYDDYGGRGITVCEEWLQSYTAFEEWSMNNGYYKTLTLDRVDNDKGYCPDNCRWVGHLEQRINSRVRKDNSSGYKGVSYRKDTNKYTSYLWLNKKKHNLGCFDTVEEAVFMRNKFIKDNKLPHKIQHKEVSHVEQK